ncbi:FAD-binding oxidoreductase [Candidatus Bipolaricaulota bacterium]|nr:FAD-binding oxidoreductase [Candidatus Bipolaricaulota bacterium]
MSSYDLIIIGAGSIGTPTAMAMAQAGVNVLVLDRLASHGQGSHKAAIGGIRATHSGPAKIRLGLRTIEIASAWEEIYGHDIEWRRGGYIFVAFREAEEEALREMLPTQQAYGLNIDWHNREELLQIVPDLNPDGLRGGTFSSNGGHCSTLLLGHAVYDIAKCAGAVFRYNERVTGIVVKRGRVKGVKTDRGKYSADLVLNVAGAWAREIGELVGLDHPVDPEAHEGGITEPVARFIDPLVVDIRPASGSANYYFFQLATGQVVFCITPQPSIWGFDRRETSAFLPMVAQRMVGLIPRLAHIRVRRTWRGLYPMTPDGSPLVGRSEEVSGYLMAIGMCGQGFMLGLGLGELLVRMVTDTLTVEDHETLNILSPSRVFQGQETLK